MKNLLSFFTVLLFALQAFGQPTNLPSNGGNNSIVIDTNGVMKYPRLLTVTNAAVKGSIRFQSVTGSSNYIFQSGNTLTFSNALLQTDTLTFDEDNPHWFFYAPIWSYYDITASSGAKFNGDGSGLTNITAAAGLSAHDPAVFATNNSKIFVKRGASFTNTLFYGAINLPIGQGLDLPSLTNGWAVYSSDASHANSFLQSAGVFTIQDAVSGETWLSFTESSKDLTLRGLRIAGVSNVSGAGTITSGSSITGANFVASGVTASRAAAWDSLKGLISATTTLAELNFVSGVTSSIQTQLDAKFSLTAGNSVSNAFLITSNAFLVTSNGLIATSNQLVTAIAALNASSNAFVTVSNNFLSVSNAHVATSNQLTTAISAINANSNALVIVSNTVTGKLGATNGAAYGLTLNGITTNAGSFYNVSSNLIYVGTAGVAQTNIHVDFSFGNEFYLLLTNNAFLIPTNMRPAQVVNIELWQDGTGSRTVGYQLTVTTNAGGLAISNAANSRSIITMKAGKYGTNVYAIPQAGFQ